MPTPISPITAEIAVRRGQQPARPYAEELAEVAVNQGLTIREDLAGRIAAGAITGRPLTDDNVPRVAVFAVRLADRLLEELAK